MQTNVFPKGTATGDFLRKNRARILAVMLCVPMALVFPAACTTSQPAPPPQAGGGPVRYIVTAESTSFYKYGPAQASGPDLRLKKDQVVTMIERHFGYSRVIDPDGDSGFVPTDDIAPAPNQPPTLANSPKKAHGNLPPDVGQPDEAPLPSKQPPSDEPEPSFRY